MIANYLNNRILSLVNNHNLLLLLIFYQALVKMNTLLRRGKLQHIFSSDWFRYGVYR